MEAVGAGMAVAVGTAVGTAAGMEAAGGTVVGGMEAIGIVGAGGPATAGAGGVGADGIPTGRGGTILMVTGTAVTEHTVIPEVTAMATAVATVILQAPKVKPQRFNPGLLTSVSIMARSTARLARVQKARSKPSRHNMA